MEKVLESPDMKGTIKEILRKATEDEPKNPNATEWLLVRPKYFIEAIENGPGLSIFKAPYGRGKTYGVGYFTFHEGKRSGKYDTIYINLREVSAKFSEGGVKLSGTAIDIPLYVCAGTLGLKFEQGSYMSSLPLDTLKKICENTDKYINNGDLKGFLENVAAKSPKRLIIVIDEFENVAQYGKTATSIAESIKKLMSSLRPGALDLYPFKLNIVLAIQYLYYPSADVVQYLQSGQPILGKMYSVNSDYTIPVEYPFDSYYEYILKSLEFLKTQRLIDDEKLSKIQIALNDKDVKDLIEQLTKLPSRIVFEQLRDLIAEISVSDNYVETIKERVNTILSGNPIYTIYIKHKIPTDLSDSITSGLEYFAKFRWGDNIAVDPVKRRGYEGVIVSATGLYRVILFKQNDVKYTQSEKFKSGFIKAYGNFLTRWCTKSITRKEDECKVIVIHPENVKVGAIIQELRNLQTINFGEQRGGIRVSLSVDEISLDDDELASLVGSVDKMGGIAGDKTYFQKRVEEIKNKLS